MFCVSLQSLLAEKHKFMSAPVYGELLSEAGLLIRSRVSAVFLVGFYLQKKFVTVIAMFPCDEWMDVFFFFFFFFFFAILISVT